MIFDTHCHLNSDELYPQVEQIIEKSLQKGVRGFVVVGWDEVSSLLAVDLAHKYPYIYAAVGFHPCNIDDVDDDKFERVMKLLSDNKVVALGEIGLDYHWVEDKTAQENQRKFFLRQIKEANKYHKPIIIHSRDATRDTLNVLKACPPLYSGVMHCFSSSLEIAKECIKLGLYISFGGPLTFKNAKQSKQVASEIDIEHILVETDCPYLTPHPFRGQLNDPSYITFVVAQLAELKQLSITEVEDITYENAKKLFHV